jgi:hypothetical protein
MRRPCGGRQPRKQPSALSQVSVEGATGGGVGGKSLTVSVVETSCCYKQYQSVRLARMQKRRNARLHPL